MSAPSDFDTRFSDIITSEGVTSAIFHTNDLAEVNMLRRSIMSCIPCYAIDIVVFDINTSPRHDEVIALRLGQSVIDHSVFVPPTTGNFETYIDVAATEQTGQYTFTTNDIPNLKFSEPATPIAELKPGQRIKCKVIVKLGTANDHVKWRPVSNVDFQQIDNAYIIRFQSINMLPEPDILRKGYAEMHTAITQVPKTIFTKPLLPQTAY